MENGIKLLVILLLVCTLACKKDKDPPGNQWLLIEVLASNLEVPWGMDYLPNGDLLFVERSGKISLIQAGSIGSNVIHERTVLNLKEGGLLGLAIDPDFSQTNYIFLYETRDSFNQVVRMIYLNDVIAEDKVILSGIPSSLFHNGGGLRFGPDGYLYAGTGDATDTSLPQMKSSLAGKILRMDKNGAPAPNNPFGNYTWTYGHRNVQGFDWNDTGVMIATEHGPSGFINGWCCHDELNKIESGNNYGWPRALAGTETQVDPSFTAPLMHSGEDTWAPSGGSFIRGEEWKHWTGNFVMAALRGERLIRFELSSSYSEVVYMKDTLNGTFYRIRNIIQAPDGSIIFNTANIDGKNRPSRIGDDKILRMYVR